jgi:putative SOS response-associated peptidase YedK
MCGRFDNLIARDAYRGLFKAQRLPKSNFPLRYNVAPTDQIPIVRIDPRDGEREVVMARWGLIPFWMKEKPKVPHINARAETVHKLPLFREGFAKRRCLIPATGFYEWQKREDGKQPYRFRRKDLEPFTFAGVWEFARLGGEEILSTAMIVGEANPLVGGVHDRMPVMLMSEDYDRWLDSTTGIDGWRPYAVWPPSMTIACPTTNAAASEHSQTTAAAISSGFPIRPTGSHAITLSRPSGVPPLKRSIIGVSMIPGHTAFTRIFDFA